MGTQFITEVVIGGIGYIASKVGTNIIVEGAVQSLDLTTAGKACVWVAKEAASSIIGEKVYKTITRRTLKEDIETICEEVTKKNQKNEKETEEKVIDVEFTEGGAQAAAA